MLHRNCGYKTSCINDKPAAAVGAQALDTDCLTSHVPTLWHMRREYTQRYTTHLSCSTLGLCLNNEVTTSRSYSVYNVFIVYYFAGVETWTLLEEQVATDVVGVSPLCKCMFQMLNAYCQKADVLNPLVFFRQRKPQRQRWWKLEEQRLGKLWLRRAEASSVQMIGNAKRKCLVNVCLFGSPDTGTIWTKMYDLKTWTLCSSASWDRCCFCVEILQTYFHFLIQMWECQLGSEVRVQHV